MSEEFEDYDDEPSFQPSIKDELTAIKNQQERIIKQQKEMNLVIGAVTTLTLVTLWGDAFMGQLWVFDFGKWISF